MSKKSPPPKTAAEVERRRKIKESKAKTRYWDSPEGQELKARMSKERKGKQTEAHRKAMADPENQRRRIEGYRRMLGVVEAEEGPGPGVVTDEERAVAAREGEPPAGR